MAGLGCGLREFRRKEWVPRSLQGCALGLCMRCFGHPCIQVFAKLRAEHIGLGFRDWTELGVPKP